MPTKAELEVELAELKRAVSLYSEDVAGLGTDLARLVAPSGDLHVQSPVTIQFAGEERNGEKYPVVLTLSFPEEGTILQTDEHPEGSAEAHTPCP